MVFVPYLITFRESIEAALVVAIIVAYLQKTGRQRLHRYVWLGVGAGVAASIALGFALLRVYGGLSGTAEEVFEGVAAIIATAVLTSMILWMARNSRLIKGEIEEKMDTALTSGFLLGIAVLTFIMVFREGVETVLFLTAVSFVDPGGTGLGVALGFVTALALAVLMLRGIARLPGRRFFLWSSLLLLIFAAGLAGFGTHEIMEAAEHSGADLGWWGEKAYNVNPPPAAGLACASVGDPGCNLFHEKGVVGAVLAALVGYDGNPENLRVVVYLGYWLVLGLVLLRTYRPRSVKEPTA